MNSNNRLLEVRNLKKWFGVERGIFKRSVSNIKAVDGVSFHINKGEILGLVGESGSGKTTIGKMLVGLLNPTQGTILFKDRDVSTMKRSRLGLKLQIIFQNPFSSLNPKLSVGTIIGEAVRLNNRTGDNKHAQENVMQATKRLLQTVGLPGHVVNDYPHQFSGGQRQRIGIARALAMDPELIIADEPVSSLDISIQAQILNLLSDLKDKYGLSYLLITHDLNVVRHVCERVMVMRNGKIVEEGVTSSVYNNPEHPYTEKLLSSIPELPL